MLVSGQYTILLIDSNPLAASSDHENTRFLTVARDGAEARRALLDPKQNFAAVVIDPRVSSPGAIRLIQLAHQHRPATPIYAVNSALKPAREGESQEAFGREEISRLALMGNIPPPKKLDELRALVSPEILDFRPNKKYSGSAELRAPLPPRTPSDSDYISVPAADFLAGTPSTFDVYIRLQSGRYLKILNAKSVFPAERIHAYLRKGVTHFHFGKASQLRCLTYCDLMARFLLDHQAVSPMIKLSHAFNSGQEIIDAIQGGGFRQEHVDYAYAFVGQTFTLVKQLKLGRDVTVKTFMSKLSNYEHSVGTALVASLLTLPLQIETYGAFNTIGIAALFHDIGMAFACPEIEHEALDQMSPAQRVAFEEHPRSGAEYLKQFEGIEEGALVAIAKHHERRDNTGFPKVEQGNELNRMAEIVGIAEEFVRLVQSGLSRQQVFAEMRERVFHGFSFPVIEAFRQIFMAPAARKARPVRLEKSKPTKKPPIAA
jgi:hypothetical protein